MPSAKRLDSRPHRNHAGGGPPPINTVLACGRSRSIRQSKAFASEVAAASPQVESLDIGALEGVRSVCIAKPIDRAELVRAVDAVLA